MLSYQHAYHAGSLADVHKHVLLARALKGLTREAAPLLYVETHAGRGRYNLDGIESRKTGEAAVGIDRLLAENAIAGDEPFLVALKRFRGRNARLYPGSPSLAAGQLRKQDKLWLWELHPREHAVLQRLFDRDTRASVFRADGTLGLPLKLPPKPPTPARGLVLIDPSYELKQEYETIPAFVRRLRQRWPSAGGMLWYPMLPAGRHKAMVEALQSDHKDLRLNTIEWPPIQPDRGITGSGVVYWGIALPSLQQPAFVLSAHP